MMDFLMKLYGKGKTAEGAIMVALAAIFSKIDLDFAPDIQALVAAVVLLFGTARTVFGLVDKLFRAVKGEPQEDTTVVVVDEVTRAAGPNPQVFPGAHVKRSDKF